MIFHWPQIVMICFLAMDMGIAMIKHGEPKGTDYNAFIMAVAIAIQVAVLYYGGFFG